MAVIDYCSTSVLLGLVCKLSVRLLVLAGQVATFCHSKHLAVPRVEPDPVVFLVGRLALAALFPAVDDVGEQAVPGEPPGAAVVGAGRPAAGDHVVARTRASPPACDVIQNQIAVSKATARGVARHQARVAHQVQLQRLPGYSS